ncbi:MFS transporter permease [Photobacterium aquae]|uniref:MFS transporter permease n=1 Tax=Photobacterium aquae TaxID=1195763 RepID=A0A0J1HB37_9GAMM|nr:MFS transporter [Photobacterium aquae]KLV08868.1 MFS transporter permease [Photobacterium aquae]
MIDVRTAEYRRASFALCLGSFLIFCNLYLFQPMLPLMAVTFEASATRVNWLVAAATLALALSLVPWAVWSERVGRRKIMMISLMLMPLVGLLTVFAQSLLMLSVARAMMGVALAGFAAVAVAYMAEEFTPAALMLAVGGYISANSLGGIAGRISGGFLSETYGWQVAVIVMALFSLAVALLVYKLLPPQRYFKPSHGQLRHQIRGVLRHLRNPVLWTAMLIGGVNFALFVNLYTVMGFRLVAEPYLVPVSWASMIFLCYLTGTVTAKLSGVWTLRFSSVSGMVLGAMVSACGLWVAWFESIPAMVIGLLLISSGSFFTHSLAYGWVSQKAQTAKATATALYLVHYYAGGSLGGFYLIYCWQHWGWGGVIVAGTVLYVVLCLLCYCLSRQEHEAPTDLASQ